MVFDTTESLSRSVVLLIIGALLNVLASYHLLAVVQSNEAVEDSNAQLAKDLNANATTNAKTHVSRIPGHAMFGAFTGAARAVVSHAPVMHLSHAPMMHMPSIALHRSSARRQSAIGPAIERISRLKVPLGGRHTARVGAGSGSGMCKESQHASCFLKQLKLRAS